MAVPTLTALATLYAALDNGFGPSGTPGAPGANNTAVPTNGNPGANSSTPGTTGATGDVAPTSNSFAGNPGLNGLPTTAPFNGSPGLPGVAGSDRTIPAYYWFNNAPFTPANAITSGGITSTIVGSLLSIIIPAAAVPAAYNLFTFGFAQLAIVDPDTGATTTENLILGYGNCIQLWLGPNTTLRLTSAGASNASATLYTI